MKFIENFCKACSCYTTIEGYFAQNLLKQTTLYIVPMVNPDGVDLVTGNIDKNSTIYQNYEAIANKYKNIPFPEGWKANFNGESLTNFHHFIFKK